MNAKPTPLVRAAIVATGLLAACATSPPPESPNGEPQSRQSDVSEAPCPDAPVCEPCAAAEPTVPVTDASAQRDSDDVPQLSVRAGSCKLGELPPSLVMSVDAAATGKLVENVERWLEDDGPRFGLTVDRGIAFAKSEDPIGYDGPVLDRDKAHSGHVCGLRADWLMAHVRTLLVQHGDTRFGDGIRCDDNVCCYDALGEYDSAGMVIFEPATDGWHLRAFAQVADNGAIMESYVEKNYAQVRRALLPHAKARCSAGG